MDVEGTLLRFGELRITSVLNKAPISFKTIHSEYKQRAALNFLIVQIAHFVNFNQNN